MGYKPKYTAKEYADILTPEMIKKDFEEYGFTLEHKEPDPNLKKYMVVFYNRVANQIQTLQVLAVNEFRAGREFYKRYNRKAYHDCIEKISEIKE